MIIKRFAALFSSLILCLLCLPTLADSITLPASLTEIAAESFLNTQAADVVVIPDGVTTIHTRAFAESSVKGIILPDTVESIAEDAFEDTALEYAVCSEDSYAAEYFAAMNVPCQEPFPSKSFITAICPWGAGGGTDAILRAFCMAMEPHLNDTPIVVDNLTGAGGVIGHEALAEANPDGHTFGMITFELSGYKHQEMSAYTYEDYDPLCLINSDSAAITVNTEWANTNGIKNLGDFISYCKNNPGEVMLGGSSSGSVWHIAGGYLMEKTGIDIRMITYANGAFDTAKAAFNGHIQGVTLSPAEVRPFVGNGLTCLGVMSSVRDPLLPNIPTCNEVGYDLKFGTFRGIALPKGVNKNLRSLLVEACRKAIQDPVFVTFMENNGQQITYLDGNEFTAYLKQHAQDVVGAMVAVDLISAPFPTPPPTPPVEHPSGSITMICPWGAGSGTDAILRAFCMAMEPHLNDTPIVVDNLTGAGGVIGHEALAEADPDGNTLGMITFELSCYKAQEMSNYTYKDFDPLCLLNTDSAAITVNTEWANANGIKNLGDFISHCKNNPGRVMLGGSSSGSVWHIAGGYLMEQAGIDIRMITYANGAAAAVKAAAQGEIQGVTVSAKEARSFIELGSLTCLGIMSNVHEPLLPDIPTCAEAGYDLEFGTFRGIALPKGVSEDVRSLLVEAVSAAINDPEFVSFMENNGQQITYLDGNDFTAYLRQHAQDVVSAMETVDLL